MLSDARLNISQFVFFIRNLRYKLRAKLFETKYKMKELYGETIFPEFGKYSYVHENDSKLELILFWIRNLISILKKETNILINFVKLNANNIDRIDILLEEIMVNVYFVFL